MNKRQICKFLIDNAIVDEQYCRPKNVAQLGNWIMWMHPDYPKEVDCFARHKNSAGEWVISGDCYHSIEVKASPFGTKCKTILKATTARLNREYRDYLIDCKNDEWLHFEDDPKRRFTHQLRAVSGDCASGALSDTDDILPFTEEKLESVYDYLLAELTFKRSVVVNGLYSKKTQKANQHFFDCGYALIRKKVFQHKWHSRTGWLLEPFDQWDLITQKEKQ
jgi:hypothetical protein